LCSTFAPLRRRELWFFLMVGAFFAVLGQVLLTFLLKAGVHAALANVAQVVVTLQLSFLYTTC